MKKKPVIILLLICCSSSLVAQNNFTVNRKNTNRTYQIISTAAGLDQLSMTCSQWDDFVAGTKYCSRFLAGSTGIRLCMEIADKYQGHCNKGIGFGCSIFDDSGAGKEKGITVNHTNRLASVMLYKQSDDRITLFFLNRIDWQSLQQNRWFNIYNLYKWCNYEIIYKRLFIRVMLFL